MLNIMSSLLDEKSKLSPVHFTSLNSILFKNIKPVYQRREKISVEYEYYAAKVEVGTRDWIGMFPRGWHTLQQYVAFQWVPQSISSDSNARTVVFHPQVHPQVNTDDSYQFVYVRKHFEVLGVSMYFKFDTKGSADGQCLVPMASHLRLNNFNSDPCAKYSKTTLSSSDIPSAKGSSIHCLHSLASPESSFNLNPFNLTRAIRYPLISQSETLFAQSPQSKKCCQLKAELFWRTQQTLQSKLRMVMMRNKVLEDRCQEMRREQDQLQLEAKKLRMSYLSASKEKRAYEKFVREMLKSLEKGTLVRVLNGGSEIMVKKVNYIGMEEQSRDKKTSKRERELKAVIGLQEQTIRNLISSLQQERGGAEMVQMLEDRSLDGALLLEDNEELRLTKPMPPEDLSDTNQVLEDIRRCSELALKDVGMLPTSLSDEGLDLLSLRVEEMAEESGEEPSLSRCVAQRVTTLSEGDACSYMREGREMEGLEGWEEREGREEGEETGSEVSVTEPSEAGSAATVCDDFYDAQSIIGRSEGDLEVEKEEEVVGEQQEVVVWSGAEDKCEESSKMFSCQFSINLEPGAQSPDGSCREVFRHNSQDHPNSSVTMTQSKTGLEIAIIHKRGDASEGGKKRFFEINVDLTGIGKGYETDSGLGLQESDSDATVTTNPENKTEEEVVDNAETKSLESSTTQGQTWNDAEQETPREEEEPLTGSPPEPPKVTTLSEETLTNLNCYQESLRYEKNLEYLLMKPHDLEKPQMIDLVRI